MSVRRRRCRAIVLAVPFAAVVTLAVARQDSQSSAEITFPNGYRSWTRVKSTLVGPDAPGFATNGGLHHFYANERAVDGYRSGAFPDGAILIDDLLELKPLGSGTSGEGSRRRLAVMVKDGRRFADTGGWGFEVFKADAREGSLSRDGRTACYDCHKKADDGVFSSLSGALLESRQTGRASR